MDPAALAELRPGSHDAIGDGTRSASMHSVRSEHPSQPTLDEDPPDHRGSARVAIGRDG